MLTFSERNNLAAGVQSRPAWGRRALLAVFLAATGLSGAQSAPGGGAGNGHFTAEPAALYESAMASPAPAGADVVVLEDEDVYLFEADGRRTETVYMVFRVVTQNGAEVWADYSADWEPWHQERPKLRARVITPDHMVHELDAKTISDAPAKQEEDGVYSDRRVLHAPLPAMAPGSVVEEEMVVRESAPWFGAGVLQRAYFGRPVPVEHTRLVLDAPGSLPLRYALELLPDVTPQRTEANGRVQISFEHGPLEPRENAEDFLPSDLPAYPHVTFSTGESWQGIAAEYGTIVDRQIAGAELKSLANKLTAGKAGRGEKAEAILQYLDKEVRYTGVEFGEAAIVPRTPAETLARKYGDCKDKSALLVALLRTAGVPAYVALLNAGDRQDIGPDLPGMGMFDHAIVYLPGEPELWIDATDQYARLGELPPEDQGRLALVARPESSALARTPVASSQDNALVEKREFYLAEYGPARVVETSLPRGNLESAYRGAYADKQNKKTQDNLTDYVKSQYLAEKLDRMDRSDPQDIYRQFELVLESKKAKRGFTELGSASMAIRLESLFARLPEELRQRERDEDKTAPDAGGKAKKKRTADYQLPQAFVTEWDYTIAPPAGFQAEPLPSKVRLTLGPAVLTEEFAAEKDGVVRAVIRFDTVKRRLTVAEAAEMRDGIADLTDGEAILISFEPRAKALLDQGKVGEALQAYRDLVALHPKEAVHHLQIAKALLAAGMGEGAREEAGLAVKLEPGSALAEKTLGEILEYDAVGRQFRPGSDYAGAEAAFRAAKKLDPADKSTVVELAFLLEHDRWGLRYGPGAKLHDAIAEYRSLSAQEVADLGVRDNLAFALLYSGEFSEALKAAGTLNPQPTALMVACEAALHGSQAALTEARKRSQGEAQFGQVANAAGHILSNLGKYSLAADLEEAGASGSDASQIGAEAMLLRKAQPHRQMTFASDPAGAALRFYVLETDPDLALEQMRAVSSRNGQAALAQPEVVEMLAKEQRAVFSAKAPKGDFADIGIDLSVVRAQPNTEGSDATGYRVMLWPSATYRTAIYVVAENGSYKVLGTSRFRAGVGLEVLDCVAAQNLAGARTLLDWLRDVQHLGGGDDPLGGEAFPRLWTKGKDADGEAMKLAAAAILVQTKYTAAQGVAVLEPALKAAKGDTERLNITLALLRGYFTLEEHEKVLAVTSELARQYPDSKLIFEARTLTLRMLGRFSEAEALAQERLKRIPEDADAMRALMQAAVGREDYEAAHRLAQKMVDAGTATADDLNSLAWYSLFIGKVTDADIEQAAKATQLSQNNGNILHTLGCLYAEVGKTKEARAVLVQAMDLMHLDEPDPNYWYAFGRIAEQYGAREIALADYARVSKPEKPRDIPSSSYRLAQNRLKAMGK